jgi:ABC-type arginine transport system ATPase subunit
VNKVILNVFEANKKGQKNLAQNSKDFALEKKVQQITQNADNLSKVFRELYSGLNWIKVFESLSELDDSMLIYYH